MDRSFFHFVTMHGFDGQTDGQTDRRIDSFFLTRPPCIQCSTVKSKILF